MPVEEKTPVSSCETFRAEWMGQLLRLYPRAWRDRYGTEVTQLLQRHRVTLWTALDLLLGAFDAHVHPDLLPGRLTSMAHRIRTGEIAVFCAFVLFSLAWLPLTLVRDPLPVWKAAIGIHPDLLTMLDLLDLAGLIATLAVVVGGVPILASALLQAARLRQWRLLMLFAIPLLAVALLAVFAVLALPASRARQSGAPSAPLTPLAVVLQISLLLLLLVAIAGSTAAVAAAVARSNVGARLLRFALLPAGVATVALAGGLLASLALTGLIFTEAPQVGFWPPLHFGDALVMLVAVIVAVLGLRRGIRASRGGVGASAS
jgi:hypothetical protein